MLHNLHMRFHEQPDIPVHSNCETLGARAPCAKMSKNVLPNAENMPGVLNIIWYRLFKQHLFVTEQSHTAHACLYIYIYIYSYMYMYIYIYIHIYVCVFIYLFIHLLGLHVSLSLYLYIYIYIYIFKCMYVRMYVRMFSPGPTALGMLDHSNQSSSI